MEAGLYKSPNGIFPYRNWPRKTPAYIYSYP